jgi:RNA recognition motif-containing protein
MIKLFVGGFPLDIDEMDLAKLFGPFGDISTIKIVRDKRTRVCKGYAFIEMLSEQGALAAMAELDGASFGGRKLRVSNVPENPPPKKRRPY